MAKKKTDPIIVVELKGNPPKEVKKAFDETFKDQLLEDIKIWAKEDVSQQIVIETAEQFLQSKGIDPPIKSAPIQNLTFEQLCELMTEYKNA